VKRLLAAALGESVAPSSAAAGRRSAEHPADPAETTDVSRGHADGVRRIAEIMRKPRSPSPLEKWNF
jgi:hypothetical protein